MVRYLFGTFNRRENRTMQPNFLTVCADGAINAWSTRPELEPSIGVWTGTGHIQQIGRIGPDDGAGYRPVCVALEGEPVEL